MKLSLVRKESTLDKEYLAQTEFYITKALIFQLQVLRL